MIEAFTWFEAKQPFIWRINETTSFDCNRPILYLPVLVLPPDMARQAVDWVPWSSDQSQVRNRFLQPPPMVLWLANIRHHRHINWRPWLAKFEQERKCCARKLRSLIKEMAREKVRTGCPSSLYQCPAEHMGIGAMTRKIRSSSDKRSNYRTNCWRSSQLSQHPNWQICNIHLSALN